MLGSQLKHLNSVNIRKSAKERFHISFEMQQVPSKQGRVKKTPKAAFYYNTVCQMKFSTDFY